MALGVFANVINAQNVILEVGTQGEVLTLFNIVTTDDSTLDRRNTRGGPIDTPTFNLREITADATISNDLYEHFESLRSLTGTGGLSSESFTITGENLSGDNSDDVSITGTYVLRRLETRGAERGRYDITLTMRLIEATETTG